ncbi:hypothetical protein [Chengkuizengella axinellae]|uniref:Uncharacterized protein n=1 Tax=Chengkuizengella axinellae TaxID=3064388 RepID=A0ABT9J6J9_9BACL|nr:hypothetical protein [Chengkuizengella sp. 2205SS18-9]MDP5277067.1 hypothetical protein [Chengkuizengella sp. 2205SS18-9]
MKDFDKELFLKYVPYIYFDKNEPFYPDRVGINIYTQSDAELAASRRIFMNEEIQMVIEYAIYWDFDIQHLYELEHVFVYINHEGEVVDCEASFHGFRVKGLLKSKANLFQTHIQLYSQPGKHAFFPRPEYFELVPDLYRATNEEAGKDGLLVTKRFRGVYSSTAEIDEKVKEYLQNYRFIPSMEFEVYTWEEDIFISSEQLYKEIPERIQAWVHKLTEEE